MLLQLQPVEQPTVARAELAVAEQPSVRPAVAFAEQ
jgi:hypothetical protein